MILVSVVVMAGEWTRLATEVAGTAQDAGRGYRPRARPGDPVPGSAASRSRRVRSWWRGQSCWRCSVRRLFGWHPLRAAGGALYVGVPACALVWLRADVPGGMQHLIWLLIVIWATDICAYLVGRTVGGPKLAPRISPGKTWSGLLGGVAGATLLGGVVAHALGAGYWLAAAVGGCLAVVGQVGDLFESALKRQAGVKDSGHLIPGHGGLLDRIDGLVFAAPVFAGLIWFGLQAGKLP